MLLSFVRFSSFVADKIGSSPVVSFAVPRVVDVDEIVVVVFEVVVVCEIVVAAALAVVRAASVEAAVALGFVVCDVAGGGVVVGVADDAVAVDGAVVGVAVADGAGESHECHMVRKGSFQRIHDEMKGFDFVGR